jgi:hypothetical protein
VAYRATKQPLDGLALLVGYCWAAIRRVKRPVTRDLMRFHRREQKKKLKAIFGGLLKFRKVDSFHLVTEQSNQKSDIRSPRPILKLRRAKEDPPSA